MYLLRFVSLWIIAFLIPSPQAQAVPMDEQNRLNVLMILVDDLRPELGCYGVDYIRSPNIDALARSGRAFHRHYVQAPTCGASRYALLTGRYGPYTNAALFQRAGQLLNHSDVTPSMPDWFRQHGYTTVSVGKVSHHPGGLGGDDWDDPEILEMPSSWNRHLQPVGPWLHPRGIMHGLAKGEIRVDPSQMPIYQAAEVGEKDYLDGLITEEALRQLDDLIDDPSRPFFLAVGFIRPHLPFGAPAKYLEPYLSTQLPVIEHPQKPTGRATWHRSGEFMSYHRWGRDPNQDADFADQVRRHYAACVSYADAQVGRIIEQLKKRGTWQNTIIVLWGDHGFHLGEHAIWGKHSLFEVSLRSPLLVYVPQLANPGVATNSIVETVDIFPTLCELADLPAPDFVNGASLGPFLENPESDMNGTERSAISYLQNAHTLRTDTHRIVVHRDGFVELYDHQTREGESKNIADQQPEIVDQLKKRLQAKWPIKIDVK